MPVTRLPIILLTVALASVLAACGGDAATTSGDETCPEAAPSPAATPPYNDDPELAGRLPTEIAGQELQVQTICITTADPGGLPVSDEFLAEVGVQRTDVTMGVSQPPSIGQDQPFVSISAFRYRGGDEATIRQTFLDTIAATGIEVQDETIGGKQVHRALLIAYYVSGDTLYAITGEDPQVEEALEVLP